MRQIDLGTSKRLDISIGRRAGSIDPNDFICRSLGAGFRGAFALRFTSQQRIKPLGIERRPTY
jgi:hypothetical protein